MSAFASCGSGSAPEETQSAGDYLVSFTDSLGNSVTLTEKPIKIAVLFSSLADIWVCAGGSVDITVGETVERGFAGEDAILVDSGAGKAIDTELLISSEPDLVICSPDIAAQAECAALLASAGIPCAALRIDCFDDYLSTLRIMCDITQNDDAYRTFGEEVKVRVDAAISDYLESSGDQGKRILFIRCGS